MIWLVEVIFYGFLFFKIWCYFVRVVKGYENDVNIGEDVRFIDKSFYGVWWGNLYLGSEVLLNFW